MMGNPVWYVKDVQPRKDYTLLLTFANGERRVYDARPLLDEEIFAPLRNSGFFMRARPECATVVWSDELDIAPEHLYECSVPVEGGA